MSDFFMSAPPSADGGGKRGRGEGGGSTPGKKARTGSTPGKKGAGKTRGKGKGTRTADAPRRRAASVDEELMSSDDEAGGGGRRRVAADDMSSSEEEEKETVDEKRIRLAKEYIRRVEAAEASDADDDLGAADAGHEGGGVDRISSRLQADAMDRAGRYQRDLAKQLDGRPLTAGAALRGPKGVITSLVVSHDGKWAFTAGKAGEMRRWDLGVDEGPMRTRFRAGPVATAGDGGHTGKILALALSTDGKLLASGGEDKMICVWDAHTCKFLAALQGHRGIVTSLAFMHGSHQLFSGSYDRTVKLWDCDEMGYMDTLFGHQSHVQAIDVMRRERPVSVGTDKTCRMWKIVDEIMVNTAHNEAPRALPPTLIVNAVAPDGVIEGAERPDRKFCLGVQWHPEFFLDKRDPNQALFRALVEAAR